MVTLTIYLLAMLMAMSTFIVLVERIIHYRTFKDLMITNEYRGDDRV